MKFYGATKRRGVLAVRPCARAAVPIAAVTFVLMFAVSMSGTSHAQDASKGDSSWERVDSVLVLPPVYQAKNKSEPADACAEDCPNLSDPGIGESSTAVAGTADNPANPSAGTADDPAANESDEKTAVDGYTPGGSGSQQEQAAAADQQSADSLDPSIGSPQDYQEQQEAQELGNYNIVQAPAVIVGAPAGGLYYLPGTSVPATSGFAPTRSLPSSPAWMPQPMPRAVPLPSIVPHGVPRTVGGFPGGFAGGFHGGFAGGFHGGFSPGFHGGFGHR